VKSDAEISEDVTGELHWDPQVTDPEAIGVAVKDRAVTPTGAVPTYAEGLAAVRPAPGVHGVKAVADELRARLAGKPRDDPDIGRATAHVPEWNTQIPEKRVQAAWVILDGEAEHEYQRHEVEQTVQHIRGVRCITNNNITGASPASPDRVAAETEEAFRREAEVDARHIRVEMPDHMAELYGHVHSLSEVAAATAAAAAPVVGRGESHLVVSQ
jgi:osmotically-inducible protein OsmY